MKTPHTGSSEKICIKCGQAKALDQFYKDKTTADKLRGSCKTCSLEAVRNYRKTEAGQKASLEATRRYQASARGKAVLADYVASDARKASAIKYTKTEKGRATNKRFSLTEKAAACRARYQQTDKWKAATIRYGKRQRELGRLKVYKLVRRKLTKQPCVECGHFPAEAHHEDYSKPLDVIWLCRQHHAKLHKEKRDAQAA